MRENISPLKELGDNKLVSAVNKLLDNIEFTNKINSTKEYMQIPFIINGNTNQCELFIYKKEKNSNNKSNKNSSVLLKLEYKTIGKLEIFINKINDNIKIDVLVENNDRVKLFKAHSDKLNKMLNQNGIVVSNITFDIIKENKNLVTEVDSTQNIKNNIDISTKRRYTLDMRI